MVQTVNDVEVELRDIRNALDRSAIVAVTDRKGTIIHVNDKFCEISKYSRDELLGQNHRVVNSGHHGPEFFKTMWETISRGQVWEDEIKNRAKDGTYYWVHTTIVPFLDKNQSPYQYVSIRYEITQRKLAEEKLQIYAQRLEFSNRELQDFASVAAHDLQEPLRKIIAFSDRLLTKFREHLPDEAKDYLDRTMRSTRRMQTLIDDLLSYSRVASRGQPFERTDLNLVLRGVLDDLEVSIEEAKAKLHIGNLPTLDADGLQMRQLLQNLIANSLKFRKPNIEPEVTISAAVHGDKVEMRIKDNGIGFDEKYLDRIFTIFQRLHGRDEYPGTGVGLAVCRKIVERHGGVITAKSQPGNGSEFIVTIPKVQAGGEV